MSINMSRQPQHYHNLYSNTGNDMHIRNTSKYNQYCKFDTYITNILVNNLNNKIIYIEGACTNYINFVRIG